MASSTTLLETILGPETLKNILSSSQDIALTIIRAILQSLVPYWPYALALLFLVLVIASIKFMLGETGMLGSLIYHALYFGILGLILLIWGLDTIFNPIFDIIYALLYYPCYKLTGIILRKLK